MTNSIIPKAPLQHDPALVWRLTTLERARALAELVVPRTFLKHELDPSKYYAQWAGAYVEVNDHLIANAICPADLLGVACEFDEFPEGCTMIRLCKQVSRYTQHICPDLHFRDALVARIDREPTKCGHIHWEVEASCRFVAAGRVKPDRVCKLVRHKHLDCPAGHDLEVARQVSRDRYYVHRNEAREAGSQGLVPKSWNF